MTKLLRNQYFRNPLWQIFLHFYSHEKYENYFWERKRGTIKKSKLKFFKFIFQEFFTYTKPFLDQQVLMKRGLNHLIHLDVTGIESRWKSTISQHSIHYTKASWAWPSLLKYTELIKEQVSSKPFNDWRISKVFFCRDILDHNCRMAWVHIKTSNLRVTLSCKRCQLLTGNEQRTFKWQW